MSDLRFLMRRKALTAIAVVTMALALAANTAAFSVLDAYVFGFVLTEVNLPFQPGESADDFVDGLGDALADHPHLAEMVATQVVGRDYAYGNEFDYGLALILDGLEARFGELTGRS